VTTGVVTGDPTETILDYADDHDVDVISMGTHGRTGLDRYVAGSVTERVVRLADVPVLTVRATGRSPSDVSYDEVLVPTDGSEAAAAAIDHGLAIAQSTHARVHAVNIVDVGDVAARPNYTPPTELMDSLESEGEAATDRIATEARERGLDATTEVREGFPASDLLDYADEHDIDLIAMGTAGHTGLGRYLLGSTTERIVRHAEMPVLAVNAREQA
jgi:nucleotide-binding universal stress UspA family protein